MQKEWEVQIPLSTSPKSPHPHCTRGAPEKCSQEEATRARAALVEVRKVLDDKDTPADVSLEQLLLMAGVSSSTYVRGLALVETVLSCRGHRQSPAGSTLTILTSSECGEPTWIFSSSLIRMHVHRILHA